jgi:hypothetical protein
VTAEEEEYQQGIRKQTMRRSFRGDEGQMRRSI